jgi:hypothetical protein
MFAEEDAVPAPGTIGVELVEGIVQESLEEPVPAAAVEPGLEVAKLPAS